MAATCPRTRLQALVVPPNSHLYPECESCTSATGVHALRGATSIGSIRKLFDFSTRHIHSTFDHFELVVYDRPVSEPRQRATVLYKEHKCLRKVLARIGGSIIRNKLLKQATVKKLQLPLFASATSFAGLIVRVTFQMTAPSLVRGCGAIAINLTESSSKPILSKETWINVIPSMCILMANSVAKRHAWFVWLMR